ncbi:hypothetical protein E2562_036818 [Oryza meyeriana var. granulata]|uniref:Uncharacterized protein n=1 Tax=Oryza meyeriana var. granulata TaxID=110450 RepID=A0A6G1E8G6_9ORYZ|nr:hypothetical protein E2562_036818 [Oryza meyeriana var. granulata]
MEVHNKLLLVCGEEATLEVRTEINDWNRIANTKPTVNPKPEKMNKRITPSLSCQKLFPIVGGIDPEQPHPDIHNCVNFVRLPIHDGICCPKKSQSMNFKLVKLARWPI